MSVVFPLRAGPGLGLPHRSRACWRGAKIVADSLAPAPLFAPWAGNFAVTLEARLMIYGLAQQWRDVADCFEEIEEQLAAKREPVSCTLLNHDEPRRMMQAG
jgi:hypothetical protein